jgi:hypothetical protein
MTKKTVTLAALFLFGVAVCLCPRLSAPKLFKRGNALMGAAWQFVG